MKLHLLVLLSLSTTACDVDGLLGTRFYGGELVPDVEAAAPDSGQEASDDDAGDPDTGSAPEAGVDSASQLVDSGHDAGIDTGVTDPDSGTTEPDSGTTVDSGEPMEATVDAGPTCPSPLECDPAGRSWPTAFCMVKQGTGNLDFTSPPACNSCGTYTCACILANSTYVPTPDTGCSCSLVNGTVSVVCP